MKLSAAHFEALAAVIREIDATMALACPLPPALHAGVMENVASRIGMMCARNNPAFDSFRFYEATGLELARFRGDAAKITATVKPKRKPHADRGEQQ